MDQSHLPDRNFDVGFFDDEPTKELIALLASANTLTLFLGAGLAADLGVPNWSTLVARLLSDLVQPTVKSASEAAAVSNATLDYYHQMPAASIVDELYRNDGVDDPRRERNIAIRKIIYESGGTFSLRSVRYHALVGYVLRFALTKKLAGCDIHLVTTNYDTVLETFAVRDRSLGFKKWNVRVESLASDSVPMDSNVIPVFHVHGIIPAKGKIDDQSIVFSESEYIEWERSRRWEDYLVPRMKNGVSVFLGASLRDYNIASMIKRSSAAKARQRIAVMPVQDELQHASLKSVALPASIYDFANRRGRHLGLDVVRPDFYGQVCQLLNEALLGVGDPTPPAYSERLSQWWQNWSIHESDDTATVVSKCDALRRTSNDVRAEFNASISSEWKVQSSKIEVWVRSEPSNRQMELWYSSQSMPLRGQPGYRPHFAEIGLASPYAAVDAFAVRSPTAGEVNHRADGRWSYFFAVPILLPRPHFELPVGVVVLLLSFGTDEMPTDSQKSYIDGALAQLRRPLERIGVELLNS